jgi:hypothetical protein
MKIRKIFLMVAFLILPLAVSVDGYSKGRGKGGAGKCGPGFGAGHRGGNPQSGSHSKGGVFFGGYYRGYGSQAYWGSPVNDCFACHSELKWFDRFRSCKYREANSLTSTEEGNAAKKDKNEWPSPGLRGENIGP